MTRLPNEFLRWNYFPRRKLLRDVLENKISMDNRFLIEFMKHTPVLCTAMVRDDGEIEVNGKVIGIGYVLKKKFLMEAIKDFEDHMRRSDEVYRKILSNKSEAKIFREDHARRGIKLLLKHVYLDENEAYRRIDFEVLSTIELAKRRVNSSKHTWNIVQKCSRACLVFYQPPIISFELRGIITIHVDDVYHKFVNLVHDSYHYTPPENRSDRPVYIFHVEEAYDNSATPNGFGRRII